jgi:hypothetical protein
MAAEKYNKALYKWLKEIYLRLEKQDETIIFIYEKIDKIDKRLDKLEQESKVKR